MSGLPMKNENMNFLEDKQKELMNESLLKQNHHFLFFDDSTNKLGIYQYT